MRQGDEALVTVGEEVASPAVGQGPVAARRRIVVLVLVTVVVSILALVGVAVALLGGGGDDTPLGQQRRDPTTSATPAGPGSTVSAGPSMTGDSGAGEAQPTPWRQLPLVVWSPADGLASPPAGLAVPSTPQNVAITDLGAGSWRIDWVDTSSNEQEFVIGDFEELRRLPANTTAYVWSDRTPWQGPCFFVAAYNAAGYSARNGTCLGWVAPPGNPDIPPARPRDLGANPLTATLIRVSWEDSHDGEAGFRLRTTHGDQVTTEDKPPRAGYGTYVVYDITVEAGVRYCFEVLAFTATQVSEWTAPVCATTTPPPPLPAAPTGLVAQAGTVAGEVVLSWVDNSDNETSFFVNRLDTTQPIDKSLPADQTTYTFSGLPSGAEICFTVYSYISGAGSSASNQACATPA